MNKNILRSAETGIKAWLLVAGMLGVVLASEWERKHRWSEHWQKYVSA